MNSVRSDGHSRTTALAFIVLVAAVFATFGWLSPGYDDEFYNIALARTAGAFDVAHWWGVANVDPVHPGGQYITNFVLHAALNDWRLVRAVSAAAAGSAVALYILASVTRTSRLLPLAAAVVAFSPTLLLWSTGLRWQSLFLALTMLLLIFAQDKRTSGNMYWLRLGITAILLCYVGYLGLVLAPLVVAWALWSRRGDFRREWPVVAVVAAAAIALYLPELGRLLGSGTSASNGQTGSLWLSTAGAAQGLLINSGLFPLSGIGIFTAFATAVVATAVAVIHWRQISRDPLAWLVIAFAVVLAVSGLGVKFRNVVPILPVFLGLIFQYGFAGQRVKPLIAAGIIVLALTNTIGAVNLLRHTRTAKGSWNLPIEATIAELAKPYAGCTQVVLLTIDPGLAWHAAERGYRVLGPYGDKSSKVPAGDCVVAAVTYSGPFGRANYAHAFSRLPSHAFETLQLGRDPDAAIKRRFDPSVPDYYVELRRYPPLDRGADYSAWTSMLGDAQRP
jgi:hypothetical protein